MRLRCKDLWLNLPLLRKGMVTFDCGILTNGLKKCMVRFFFFWFDHFVWLVVFLVFEFIPFYTLNMDPDVPIHRKSVTCINNLVVSTFKLMTDRAT